MVVAAHTGTITALAGRGEVMTRRRPVKQSDAPHREPVLVSRLPFWGSGFFGYLSLDVWPARQARNAAAACSRSSALLNLRRGCFGGSLATGGLSLRSSTPCRRMRLRLAIRDQFARTITPPPSTSAKPPGKSRKTGGFAVAPQTGHGRWGCRTDNAGAVLPRSDPASIHPRIAAWYKLGKGRCQRVHSKAAGTCRITGGFALAPQTSSCRCVVGGGSNRSAEVTMHFVPADCQGGGRPVQPGGYHTPAPRRLVQIGLEAQTMGPVWMGPITAKWRKRL